MSDDDQRGAGQGSGEGPGAQAKPIEEYALIGDLHTAALVARDGSIDWLCLPRFDARACFAALLGDASAGHWRIAPADARATSTRQYADDTLLLETRWTSADGSVLVTDFMAPRGEAATVVRIVEGLTGRVEMRGTMRLRFDYGRVRPWLHLAEDARELRGIAGPDAVWLRADVPLHADGDACHTGFTVAAGEKVAFTLTYRASYEPAPARVPAAKLRERAVAAWHDWISRCRYDGRWQPEVRRSLLLLKALTYAPTGGIVAAATTSLPEAVGGERNWDYRYCWLRDATFTLQALLGTGYTDEAKAWREWLVRAVAGDAASLQIMYGLDGSQRFPESTLDWLSGYAGSRPVRIGNAAAGQHQLDVWGETLDGLYLTREAGLHATESAWDLQLGLLDWLESHWDEPDNGLWEMRGQRRHFVHSKVLAWAGVDRAIRTVERHGLSGPVDAWRQLAEKIRGDVLEHGYDAERNTFTQFYGSRGLDASLLLLPRVHFLPWDDDRVVGTIRAVRRELDDHGLLRRYDPDADGGDGLSGSEGAFVACNFWLADALHGIGEKEEAERVFTRLLALRNDVGMLSEEYDAAGCRQLGNTPQAFSLVGLINSARHLSGTRPSASTDIAGH
jgi:GH15 family glucan-1,4-alpha-glucosidase